MTITKLFKFQFQRNYKEIYRFLIITKFKFSFNLPRNKFFYIKRILKIQEVVKIRINRLTT